MAASKYAPRLRRSLRKKKSALAPQEHQKSDTSSANLSSVLGNQAFQNVVEQNPQALAADSHFRGAVGNHALQRLISQRNQSHRPVIQRLISVERFDEKIPPVKGYNIRKQIRAGIKEYHSYVKTYSKKFPKKDFYAVNDYHQNALQWITSHFLSIADMVTLFAGGLNDALEKDGQKDNRDDPRISMVRMLNTFAYQLRKAPQNTYDDFEAIHHDLMLQAAAKNPQFQFLTEQNLEGEEIEGAAEGGINMLGMGTFNTPQGRKTGYTKEDQGKISDAGKSVGITQGDSKASLRSVATYEVNELMGLGIIPYTSLTKQKDKNTGKEKIGQFMEKVSGTVGQGKVITNEIPENKLRGISQLLEQLKDPQLPALEKRRIKEEVETELSLSEGFTEKDGKVYALESAATDIDWDNAVLQQNLNTLQFFDLIVGHADRHAGNYIIDSDPNNRENITGVKGIDNDDAWGNDQTSVDFGNPKKGKTPNLPPVIDMVTALRILKTQWDGIQVILEKYGMTNDEIAAAANRFYAVQDHVIVLARQGSIATLSGKADLADLVKLQQLLKVQHSVTIDIKNYPLMQWGEQTSQLLNETNSYTGKQKEYKKTQLNKGGQLYQPEWN